MLPCLHIAQEAEGYITRRASQPSPRRSAPKSDEVESVVTFYSMYRHRAAGRARHQGLHQHLLLSARLRRYCSRIWKAPGHQARRDHPRRQFHPADGECLAACGMAPVLQVNDEFVENVTHGERRRAARRLSAARRRRAAAAGGRLAGRPTTASVDETAIGGKTSLRKRTPDRMTITRIDRAETIAAARPLPAHRDQKHRCPRH